jgi:Nucleotidyl transferase AbiEii toxin, Type IV TA system
LEDVLDEGVAEIVALAANLGATTESILTSPDFRRLLLRREDEAVLIDLVRERVRQMISQKPVIRGIRVDPPQEILANKLCALLARAEIRDLVDLRALESVGYRIEDVIQAAAAKDASLAPGQLS